MKMILDVKNDDGNDTSGQTLIHACFESHSVELYSMLKVYAKLC